MTDKRPRGSKSCGSKSDEEDELVRRLTARLTRIELEALVVANVRSGAGAITRAELEARLPERLQSRDVQRIEVRAGASREGTGLFDTLDGALLQTILARLDPLDRVRVTRVCKSWLGLRGCAELFSNLEDWTLSMRHLKGFVGWLPLKGAEVRELAVVTSGKSKQAALADQLPALLSRLPSLTALSLSGNKTPANAIVAAAKAFGARLKRFELHNVEMYDPGVSDTVHRAHDALVAAAKQLPQLETLALPGELLNLRSDGELPASNGILRALQEARGGGMPVLRTLLVGTCHKKHSQSPWEWMARVGAELPELEVLHAHNVKFRAPAAGAVHAAWAPLPRLRELELVFVSRYVHSASDEPNLLSDLKLGAVLKLIFEAAPGLERLLLDASVQRDYASVATGSADPLPAIAGVLAATAPKSLRELCLCNVDAADLADLEPLDLPNLRALSLCNCGPLESCSAVARSLAAKYDLEKPGRFRIAVSSISSMSSHHSRRGSAQRRPAAGSAGVGVDGFWFREAGPGSLVASQAPHQWQ